MKKAGLLDKEPLKATAGMIKTAKEDKGEKKTYKGGYTSYCYMKYHTRIYFRARELGNILEVDVYTRMHIKTGRKEPIFRIFLNKNENAFATYDCVDEKWSNAKIDNLEFKDNYVIYEERPRETATEQSVMTVNRYLGTGYRMNIWGAVLEFQQHVRKDNLKKAHKLITDRIDDEMALVPELPKNWGKWVIKYGFYKNRYLFYGKDKKRGYCECCGKIVDIREKPLHNVEGRCQECGSRIIYKSWNRQKQVEDKTCVAILQKCMDGRNYVLRQFTAIKKHWKDKEYVPEVKVYEDFRTILNEHMKNQTSYEFGEFMNTGIMRWCDYGHINHGGYYSYYYRRGTAVLYHENLKRVLKDSDLKYFPMAEIVRNNPGSRIEVENTLWELTKNTGTLYEKLYKMGLKNFVSDQVMHNRRLAKIYSDSIQGKPWEAIGISKEAMKQAVRMNVSDRMMRILQYMSKRKVTITDEQLLWIDKYIGPHVILKYFGIYTPHKMIRYMKEHLLVEQDGESSRALHLWTDYLDMVVELQYQLNEEQIFFPQNVEQAHDEAAQLLQEKKDKMKAAEKREKDRIMRKNAKEIREVFAYEDDNFVIKVPQCWKDFKKEGNAQHNCVSTYFDRAVRKETIILFIRKKEEPDKSFCTVEIGKKGFCFSIVQNRIAYNKEAPEEAKDFLEKVVKIAQDRLQKKLGIIQDKKQEEERITVAV